MSGIEVVEGIDQRVNEEKLAEECRRRKICAKKTNQKSKLETKA